MKTMSSAEASEWSKLHKISFDEGGKATGTGDHFLTVRFETPKNASRHLWFCRMTVLW